MSERKIKITVSKTIQEKQYEPLIISISEEFTTKVDPSESEIRKDVFDDIMCDLSDMFEEKGLEF